MPALFAIQDACSAPERLLGQNVLGWMLVTNGRKTLFDQTLSPMQDLTDLADRMAHSIQVKDRYRHFKKYQMCFTGAVCTGVFYHLCKVRKSAATSASCGMVARRGPGRRRTSAVQIAGSDLCTWFRAAEEGSVLSS